MFINNDLTREQMQAEKQLRETKKKILQHPDYKGKKITIYRNRICVDHSPITEDMLRSAGVSILDIGQKAHSICTWNINGLTSKKFIYLFDYFTKYDIILLCETWLKPNHRYNMDIKGYKLISTYRSQLHHKAKRGSGGLMCYIKEEFQEGVEYITCNKTSEDRIWIKLSSNFFGFLKDVYLRLVYIIPECQPM